MSQPSNLVERLQATTVDLVPVQSLNTGRIYLLLPSVAEAKLATKEYIKPVAIERVQTSLVVYGD